MMISEYLSIFRRNLPYVVRRDASVCALFSHEGCQFLEKRGEDGALLALLCYHENVILLLCVDAPYRNLGWGSELLGLAEEKIRAGGYADVRLGAGVGYLVPGVPTHCPAFSSASETCVLPEWEDTSGFFTKRGYRHAWDCNCFDMAKALSPEDAFGEDALIRLATPNDKAAVLGMMADAHPSFTRHYQKDALYQEESDGRVLVFCEGNKPIGALIATVGADGIGSIGCVAVLRAFRGQGVAMRLVRYATGYLARRGANFAFVGYTYSGMERLYGKCSYKITSYYLMGKKDL